MFRFKDQFRRYERPFIAIVEGQDGYYDPDTGKYVPPTDPQEVEMRGIIANVGTEDLKADEGGLLSREDKTILVDADHYQLHTGQIVIINGERYKVVQLVDFRTYSHILKAYVKKVQDNGA